MFGYEGSAFVFSVGCWIERKPGKAAGRRVSNLRVLVLPGRGSYSVLILLLGKDYSARWEPVFAGFQAVYPSLLFPMPHSETSL